MQSLPNAWKCSSWEKSANSSNLFDSFKVYIIRCWNDDEEFYKIGRTYRSVKNRFREFKYNYDILHEFIFDNAKEAFDKETELKRLHKKYSYLPLIKFDGRHECFIQISLEKTYGTD